MNGLKRYEWKHRLKPVLRILALVLVVEGGLKVAEVYSASPLPRLLSVLSTADPNSVNVNVSQNTHRRPKIGYKDYDPYAGNRSKAEKEETAEAPPEEAEAVALPVGVDNLPPPNLPRAERRCLAEAVYFEGRNETIEGQIAVAQVVLNRVRSGKWPNTVCGVVHQGRGEACAFPGVCKAGERPSEKDEKWQRAAWIADDTAAGRAWLNELTDATHYHNASAKPVWRVSMKFIRKVGWRMYYSDPKKAENLIALSPGQAPLAGDPAVLAAEAATSAKRDADAAGDAKRQQRERMTEQRARFASAEARQQAELKSRPESPDREKPEREKPIAKSAKVASSPAPSKASVNAAEVFSRMERN
jgi:spore germination cell wall hydrolase CwlJ-like protein